MCGSRDPQSNSHKLSLLPRDFCFISKQRETHLNVHLFTLNVNRQGDDLVGPRMGERLERLISETIIERIRRVGKAFNGVRLITVRYGI